MTKAKGPLYAVHFRRRREGKTDYGKRLALLKSEKTRLVVRKTNKRIIVQFVNFNEKGDHTITSATSTHLSEYGFPGKCNTPSAYLTGMLAARKAQKKGVKEFILDIGLHSPTKGSVVFAALKGAVDAGLTAPYDESILPPQDRIEGKHLKGGEQNAFAEAKTKIMSL
ncbi:MAG: 50S ribosomal protein L18 [Candidatus Micrarchaeia archaeon]|jgi:large subunit ribosomal protein L18